MNTHDLTELLVNAGVNQEEAEMRARSYVNDQELDNRLEKSLTALEDVAEAQRMAEDLAHERLSKAFDDGESSLASSLAPALDAMLEETRTQNMALCKSFAGVLEIMKSLRDEVRSLRNTAPQKEVEAMAKSVDYIPSPYYSVDAGSTTARDDLFKALSSTKVESATHASELLQMATLLESGASIEDVKARFNTGVK